MLLACSAFQQWWDGEETEGNSGYLRVWDPLSPPSITTTITCVKVFYTSLWMFFFKGIGNQKNTSVCSSLQRFPLDKKKWLKTNRASTAGQSVSVPTTAMMRFLQAWKVQRCQLFAEVSKPVDDTNNTKSLIVHFKKNGLNLKWVCAAKCKGGSSAPSSSPPKFFLKLTSTSAR